MTKEMKIRRFVDKARRAGQFFLYIKEDSHDRKHED